jgi:hypothetical protein
MAENQIKFNCSDSSCHGHGFNYLQTECCPYCGNEMNPLFESIQQSVQNAIKELPVQISRPLYELYSSGSYFKRLHLISDILLAFLRLKGHALAAYQTKLEFNDGEIDQLIETQFSRDTHGGWTALCTKVLKMLLEQADDKLPGALYSLFGISVKHIRQPKINRPTVKNEVIDWKGKKQLVQVTNTPLELY